MGKKKKKKKGKIKEAKIKPKKITEKEETVKFDKKNYSLFTAGIVCIVLGYLSLSKGSITLAPILLVLGYVILIPISIIVK